MALQRFSFKTEHIEEAMKNTLLYGGDLHSALDWLCLNLPNGEYGDRKQFLTAEKQDWLSITTS